MGILNLVRHLKEKVLSKKFVNVKKNYRRLPRLPPFLLVASDGTGVTSSILPIFIPALARALIAAWPPGPGVFCLVPPRARTLS